MQLNIVIHRPNPNDIEARKEAMLQAWERLRELKRRPIFPYEMPSKLSDR